jgi:hypothetical protein
MRTRTAALVLTVLVLTNTLIGVGCSSGGAVPANAMLTAEGTRRLPYTTTAAGTLYVVDKTSGSLIYSGNVEAGRKILVDPDANRIYADDQVLQERQLTSGHTYRVFFQPLEKP